MSFMQAINKKRGKERSILKERGKKRKRKRGKKNRDLSQNLHAFLVVVVAIAVAASIFYIHRQRREVVKALVQAEEGERRNYKIDYSALVMGEAIGQGGFGVVYKGEYLSFFSFPLLPPRLFQQFS
jgi:hypothetical protein